MRVQVLALLAKLLRIQFKIDGIPYGASYQFREELFNHSAQP